MELSASSKQSVAVKGNSNNKNNVTIAYGTNDVYTERYRYTRCVKRESSALNVGARAIYSASIDRKKNGTKIIIYLILLFTFVQIVFC